jgi:hypothetical protein
MQKILYLQGVIKYLDFKNKRRSRKKSEHEKHLTNEDAKILQDAIASLSKSLNINVTMKFNQFKAIFMHILISKCHYYLEDYSEAMHNLKEAMLKISDLNKYLLESVDDIDPRVMFISNGIILESLLYNLGKVCEKLGKKKQSAWVFNRMMEITYYRSNSIHRKACKKMKTYLFENNNFFIDTNNIVAKLHLEKMSNRFDNDNKKFCITVSETLLGKFPSTYELKEMLLSCVNKYISQNDLISYFQFDSGVTSKFDLIAKYYNMKNFQTSSTFCKHNNSGAFGTDFYGAMCHGINTLTEDEREHNQLDKYIFIFIYAEDFKFNSEEENKELARKFIDSNVTVYVFIFDEFVKEKKLTNIKKYLKDLVEGYLIWVRNFEIIEQAFQNISICSKNKNILDSNYDNYKYIS